MDYQELLSDGPYKERFRGDMIRWGEQRRRADPEFFARIVMGSVTQPVVIISDGRRLSDRAFFRTPGPDKPWLCLTVRVEATQIEIEACKS